MNTIPVLSDLNLVQFFSKPMVELEKHAYGIFARVRLLCSPDLAAVGIQALMHNNDRVWNHFDCRSYCRYYRDEAAREISIPIYELASHQTALEQMPFAIACIRSARYPLVVAPVIMVKGETFRLSLYGRTSDMTEEHGYDTFALEIVRSLRACAREWSHKRQSAEPFPVDEGGVFWLSLAGTEFMLCGEATKCESLRSGVYQCLKSSSSR